MRWQLTTCFIIMAVGFSYGLYKLSYEVQALESELAGINREIEDNKQSVEILKAEWAYQNRPDTIQALTAKYLPLLLVAPYQVATFQDLPDRQMAPEVLEALDNPVPRRKPRFEWVYEEEGPDQQPAYTVASYNGASIIERQIK